MRLLLANRHPMLGRLFLGTPWAYEGWRPTLARVPGAWHRHGHLEFAGVKARAWSLPLTVLPSLGEDEGAVLQRLKAIADTA